MKHLLILLLTGSSLFGALLPCGEPPGVLSGPYEPSLFLRLDLFDPARLKISLSASGEILHERVMGFSSPVSEYNTAAFLSPDTVEISGKPSRFVLLSLGSAPFRSFNYSLTAASAGEIRTVSAKGAIRSWHASAFALLPGTFYAGAKISFLSGKSEKNDSITFPSDASLNQTSRTSNTFAGWKTGILAGVRFLKIFNLAGFVSLPAKVSKDKTSFWTFPLETGLRFTASSVKPEGFDASFFCEAVYANGRNFREENTPAPAFTPSSFRDAISLLAGTTFRPSRRTEILFRTGGAWMPLMNDRYSDRIAVFFGSLIPAGKSLSFSCDAVWSLRPYRNDGVFYAADTFVQENIFRLNLGASYAFR